MIRPPEWVPAPELNTATYDALTYWFQKNPRYKRPPCYASDREQLLVYAWTMRDWPISRIAKVAVSVLSRTSYNFPEPRELEAEYAERLQRAQLTAASQTTHTQPLRWNGEEDAGCPTCGTLPRYSIQRGAQHAAWVFTSPACGCCGWMATTMHSLHLRGVLANPEDNPVELARMYRKSAEGLITNWRVSGRRLADVLREASAA